MKIFSYQTKSEFAFEKYIGRMLGVVRKEDILGISEIRIVEIFSDKRCMKETLGCYLPEKRGKFSVIELNIISLLKYKISGYLFTNYPEIAALFLSEVVFHEIGHHVHRFKRHKIRDHEGFAHKYSVAGYYNYLKSYQSEILSSYRRASWNIFDFDRDARKGYDTARKELIEWLRNNEQYAYFP